MFRALYVRGRGCALEHGLPARHTICSRDISHRCDRADAQYFLPQPETINSQSLGINNPARGGAARSYGAREKSRPELVQRSAVQPEGLSARSRKKVFMRAIVVVVGRRSSPRSLFCTCKCARALARDREATIVGSPRCIPGYYCKLPPVTWSCEFDNFRPTDRACWILLIRTF